MASAKESNVKFVCVGTTDVGRVREHNEDNFLVARLSAGTRGKSGEVFSGPMEEKGLSLVVADGMGGAAAGEVASQMAVDTIHAELAGADLGGTIRSEEAVIGLLEGAINKANEAIFRKGQESKDHQGMGTTLTAAMVLGDSLYLSQVGDSRGYLLRKGKLVQMTRDQSLIGQLIEEGTLTEEQAEKLGGKNIILQALGVEETLKIDSKRYDILRGDTLLLCSDGLSGMAPDSKLEEILVAEHDLQKAGKMLIEAANAGGGKDNITCVLARFEGDGLREPLTPVTDADKAGGTFRAPTLKKSNAGRNAVIGMAAILGVVGAVLFWPKPVTLRVTAGPKPGNIRVVGAKEGGPEKFPEVTKDFQPGTPIEIELPRGKKFDVTAEAPGYKPQTMTGVDTKVDTREISQTFTLVRIPAPTADFVPPKFKGKSLTKVQILLQPKEGQTSGDKPIDVTDSPTPEYPDGFPAGLWSARVMRAGFADGKVDFEAVSDVALVVPLPDLVQSTGGLVVTGLPEGAEVTIFEGEEPLLEKPEIVTATHSTSEQQVRATEVVVKASMKGYEFQDVRLTVKTGETATAKFGNTMAKISFKGPDGSKLTFTGTNGQATVTWLFKAGGKSVLRTVAAGTYKAVFEDQNGDAAPPYDFTVEPGRVLLDLDAATGK